VHQILVEIPEHEADVVRVMVLQVLGVAVIAAVRCAVPWPKML